MRFSSPSFILTLLYLSSSQAAEPKSPKAHLPCTITSPSGSFYDLNPIAIQPLVDGKKAHKDDREESWKAKGYDYGADFKLNICAPVIEELENVVGVDEKLWRNISAYYTKGRKTYSMGQMSTAPVFRGRKLVLNYTMGSPCDSTSSVYTRDPLKASKEIDDDDDIPKKSKSGSDTTRRKSTIISLLCDRDLADATAPKATVAFIAASPDECTYFFEARSVAACGGAKEEQAVGPAGVFGLIALIALAAYLVGGIAYQRAVMHQRGWKQIPNYSLWSGMFSFVKDMIIILFSSCTRFLPSRKGYNQLPTHNTPRGRGSSRAEDENRLIDQLDEEWDD